MNASIDVTGQRLLPPRNFSSSSTETTGAILSVASPPLMSSTPTFQVEATVLSNSMDIENETSENETSLSRNNLNQTIYLSESSAEQLSFSSSSNETEEHDVPPSSLSSTTSNDSEGHDVQPSSFSSISSVDTERQDVSTIVQTGEIGDISSDHDSEAGPLLNEADTVMEEAAKLLGPKSSSLSSTSSGVYNALTSSPETDVNFNPFDFELSNRSLYFSFDLRYSSIFITTSFYLFFDGEIYKRVWKSFDN